MQEPKNFIDLPTFLLRMLTIVLISTFAINAFALGIKPPKGNAAKPPTATPKPTPAPTPKPPTSGFVSLWSGKHADAANWDAHVHSAITNYGAELLKGPSDVSAFCPMYDRLGTQDRLNFWVQLFAAMTKYESSFKPTMRFTESSMGIDPVTNKQVVSEGLLQLSYQDEKWYKNILPSGVCDFDYVADQKLGISDIRRTIFNPKNNLTCGIGIMNRQVQREGKLAVGKNAYWSVLKTTASHNKIKEIQAITNALSFCKK